MKKKLFAIALALTMTVGMAVPAFAVTPTLKPPKLPTIPEIKVEVEIPESFWDKWFAEHPIDIDWSKIQVK